MVKCGRYYLHIKVESEGVSDMTGGIRMYSIFSVPGDFEGFSKRRREVGNILGPIDNGVTII